MACFQADIGAIFWALRTPIELPRRTVRKFTRELGHVDYEEQVLSTGEGKMVFGGLAVKGGLTLKMCDLSKQPLAVRAFIALVQLLATVSIVRVILCCIKNFMFGKMFDTRSTGPSNKTCPRRESEKSVEHNLSLVDKEIPLESLNRG